MLNRIRWHPVLLAVYPILHLYARNVADAYFPWVLLALAIATAVFLVLIFLLVARDLDKASLLASLVLIWLVFGINMSDTVASLWPESVLGVILAGVPIVLVSLVALALGIWLMFTKVRLTLPNQFLSVSTAVMVLLAGYSTATALATDYRMAKLVPAETNPLDVSVLNLPNDRSDLPNIVYIIADARASERTLQYLFDYSSESVNSEFAKLDFLIAADSMANYGTTAMALSSSLNMNYVEFPAEIVDPKQKYSFLIKQIENNRVAQALQAIGYQYIHVASGFKATNGSSIADIVVKPARYSLVDDFAAAILINLAICRFLCDDIKGQFAANFEWLGNPDWYRRRIRFPLQQLDEIDLGEKPTFLFIHVVAPHGPYVLDSKGRDMSVSTDHQTEQSGSVSRKEGYLEQLQYIDNRLISGVRSLLARTERATVVVLQSDHGPSLTASEGLAANDPRVLAERMFVLNAFRLPGVGIEAPYDEITPVNNFRYLFNAYFDAELEMLPDRSYLSYFPGKFSPEYFNYEEITDRLQSMEWERLQKIDDVVELETPD
jgi:hypothetical protein